MNPVNLLLVRKSESEIYIIHHSSVYVMSVAAAAWINIVPVSSRGQVSTMIKIYQVHHVFT